jgi:membrane protease YdiL (CAAX protease family)
MSAPENSSSSSNVLSWQAINWAEVISVILSILLAEWALAPFAISPWLLGGPPFLAFLLMLHSHRCRGETAQTLGFGGRYLDRSLLLLSGPTLLAIAALIFVSYLTHSLHLPDRFWARLSLLPVWALLQQYTMLGFAYRRLRQCLHANQSITITASLFALLHAPSYPLMILTFVGGLIWSFVYERAPNLFASAISHMLLSATVLVAVPEWILPSMTVGYRCLLHQNF